MSENRCRRCNRKLIDPDAVYGWRCAKKLGVSVYMVSADGLMWQYFYDGIAIGDIIIASENLELSYDEMLELYSTVIKWSLANGVNDKYLMKLAKDDSISLSFFMSLYKSKYGENEGVLHHHAEKPELSALQKYLNLQNYKHDLGNRMNFVDLVYKYLTLGYVTLLDGRTIDSENYDVKNPVLDYEWKGNSDFDYASALFKISSFTNTAVGGIATSYDAAEKRKGKLKKDQTTSIIKKWGKTSTSAITSNITQYAGKIAKDSTYVSIALCGIEIGQDYFDDKKFGEGTAAALAGTIASGVAMSATATALAAFAWPTAAVAGASIVVAMVADYAVRRGIAYINSKRGQDELKQLSANLFDSLIQNPDELNKVVNRIAKDNVMVAEILENEKRAFEKEVEDIIMVGDYNRDVPLIMSKAEYGIA